MIIRTDQPLIQDRGAITQQIANFWNQISAGWHTIWGVNIHHGFYENDEPINPKEAQEKLIVKLAEEIKIAPGDRVLDVGCGMGGTSMYLAKHYDAIVTGITLSQKQIEIATDLTKTNQITNVEFKIEDALSLASFPDNSFDVVWSLESCEQFFDKKLFLQQAYRVLKPNGKLMLATWCSSHDEYQDVSAQKYKKLCAAFDLPYMPSIEHYRQLVEQEKFKINSYADWTDYVARSWDIGVSLVNAYSFLKLLKMGGWRGWRFAKQIKLMQKGFHENRVRYGVFFATK